MSDQGYSPPQWAEDPSRRHRFRYWDGLAWTGHVFDGEVPPVTAPGAPPTQPAAYQPIQAQPVEAQQTEYQPREYQPTPVVVERDDEHPADAGDEHAGLGRHRPPSSGGSFWVGALAGALVVAVVAAIAWVALGGSSSSKTTVSAPATTITTGTPSSSSATSTTVTTVAARPPAQVRVDVLNGSAVVGAAGTKSAALKTAGYMIAGTSDTTLRQGTVVACKTGFDAEAAALAKAVGSGATTEPFPSPAPVGSTNADCVVILGK